jgi:hypothetical protein
MDRIYVFGRHGWACLGARSEQYGLPRPSDWYLVHLGVLPPMQVACLLSTTQVAYVAFLT